MFDLDSWVMPENRSDRQKQIQAIYLPYKCGRIEAELIANRFINHNPITNSILLQPTELNYL